MDRSFRMSEVAYNRIKALQKYGKSKGLHISMKSIVEESVNIMPVRFFKIIRKGKK